MLYVYPDIRIRTVIGTNYDIRYSHGYYALLPLPVGILSTSSKHKSGQYLHQIRRRDPLTELDTRTERY